MVAREVNPYSKDLDLDSRIRNLGPRIEKVQSVPKDADAASLSHRPSAAQENLILEEPEPPEIQRQSAPQSESQESPDQDPSIPPKVPAPQIPAQPLSA